MKGRLQRLGGPPPPLARGVGAGAPSDPCPSDQRPTGLSGIPTGLASAIPERDYLLEVGAACPNEFPPEGDVVGNSATLRSQWEGGWVRLSTGRRGS